jgi:hypothetical protein
MVNYHEVKVNFTDNLLKKLLKAVEDQSEVSIKLSKETVNDIMEGKGNVVLYLTQTQLSRIQRIDQKGVGMVLKLSRAQVNHLRKMLQKDCETMTEEEIKVGGNPLLMAAIPTLVSKGLELLGLGLGDKGLGDKASTFNTEELRKHSVGSGAKISGAKISKPKGGKQANAELPVDPEDPTSLPAGKHKGGSNKDISLDKIISDMGYEIVEKKNKVR